MKSTTKPLMAALVVLIFANSAQAGRALPKADWLEAIMGIVPEAVCEKEERFRVCYRISAKTCVAAAETAITTCLEEMKHTIPTVVTASDNVSLGDQLGACATAAFDRAMATRRLDTVLCRNLESLIPAGQASK